MSLHRRAADGWGLGRLVHGERLLVEIHFDRFGLNYRTNRIKQMVNKNFGSLGPIMNSHVCR